MQEMNQSKVTPPPGFCMPGELMLEVQIEGQPHDWRMTEQLKQWCWKTAVTVLQDQDLRENFVAFAKRIKQKCPDGCSVYLKLWYCPNVKPRTGVLDCFITPSGHAESSMDSMFFSRWKNQ